MTIDTVQANPDSRAFSESVVKLFHKFFNGEISEEEARSFCGTVKPKNLETLFRAVQDIGAPEDHLEDDFSSVEGFFEFIDFVTAVAYQFREAAIKELDNFEDSPTNRHYIHYIRKYLSEDRFMKPILANYPYCA